MLSIPSVTCTVQTRFCHGVALVGRASILRLKIMMPFRREEKKKATRCQWRVCAAAVAACGSSASWIRGTRTLFSGSQLLEGASACVQCFVRKETASVRSVVRLWREDAGPRHDQKPRIIARQPHRGHVNPPTTTTGLRTIYHTKHDRPLVVARSDMRVTSWTATSICPA